MVKMYQICFRWAGLVASLLLHEGIPVHLFSKVVPTPFVVSSMLFLCVLIKVSDHVISIDF